MIDELQKAIDHALKLGAEFADARYEKFKSRHIIVVNGSIRTFNSLSRPLLFQEYAGRAKITKMYLEPIWIIY